MAPLEPIVEVGELRSREKCHRECDSYEHVVEPPVSTTNNTAYYRIRVSECGRPIDSFDDPIDIKHRMKPPKPKTESAADLLILLRRLTGRALRGPER